MLGSFQRARLPLQTVYQRLRAFAVARDVANSADVPGNVVQRVVGQEDDVHARAFQRRRQRALCGNGKHRVRMRGEHALRVDRGEICNFRYVLRARGAARVL